MNVYVPDVWLLTIAGFHVPVTPLFETVGNAGTVPPLHIESVLPILNVGVMFGFIVIVNVAGVAH